MKSPWAKRGRMEFAGGGTKRGPLLRASSPLALIPLGLAPLVVTPPFLLPPVHAHGSPSLCMHPLTFCCMPPLRPPPPPCFFCVPSPFACTALFTRESTSRPNATAKSHCFALTPRRARQLLRAPVRLHCLNPNCNLDSAD